MGYILAMVTLGSDQPSPQQTLPLVVPSSASVPRTLDEADTETSAAGWKKVHVFYGKTDHLTMEIPMAQAKQDEYVAAMLGQKKNGYFVDLAANDAT